MLLFRVSGYVRKHYSFDAYCLRKAREYLKNKEVPMDEAEKVTRPANLGVSLLMISFLS